MENAEMKQKLGAALRTLRTRKGMTQEGLEKFGISHRYYRRLEGGKTNPTLDTLIRLCRVFDSSLPELFSLMEPDPEVSPEGQELERKIRRIVLANDAEMIRKLNLLLDEIL